MNPALNQVINSVKVRAPWQLIHKCGQEIDYNSMKYPLLVKANTSSITEMAHIMSIVFNELGLNKALSLYSEDTVLQEFINHDMTVYKIYVIGDQISYNPRESCSNVCSNNADIYTFDSAKPWGDEIKSGNRIIKSLDLQVIQNIAEVISQNLGLTMYGYDILIQTETGDYTVIDINVFPGFKEYSNVGIHIEALIRKMLKNQG